MSQLIEMLEQLSVSTKPQSGRQAEIGQLAQQSQLNPALMDAMLQADLSGLVHLAGMPGRGCFVIVAPDVPEQQDDEPQDEPAQNNQH